MEQKKCGINQLFVDLDGYEIDLNHIMSVREIILNAPGVEKLRRIEEINFEDSIRVLKQLGNVCETFEKQLMADPQLRNSFIQERWKKPDRFLTSILTSLVKNNILPDKMKQENGRNLFFCTLKEFQSSMLSFLLELGLTNEEISEYGNATLTEVVNEMKAEGLVGTFKPPATVAASVVPPADETCNISQTAHTASDDWIQDGPNSFNIETSRKIVDVHSAPSQTNKVKSDVGEYSQECVSSLPTSSAASTNGNQASSRQPPPSYSFFNGASDCLPSTSSRPISVSSSGNLIPLSTSMTSFQRPSPGASSRVASSVIPSFSGYTSDDHTLSTSSRRPLPSYSSCTVDSSNCTPAFVNPSSVSFNSSQLAAAATTSIQGQTTFTFPTAASEIIPTSSAPSFSAPTNLLLTSSTSSGQHPTDVAAALDNPCLTSTPPFKLPTNASLIPPTTSKTSSIQEPSSSTEVADVIPASSAPNDDPTLSFPSDQQPPSSTAALGNLPPTSSHPLLISSYDNAMISTTLTPSTLRSSSFTSSNVAADVIPPLSRPSFSASFNDNPSFGLPPPSYSTLTATSDLLPPSSSQSASSFPTPIPNSRAPSAYSARQPPSYSTCTSASACFPSSSAQSFSKPIIDNPTSTSSVHRPSSCLSFTAASEDKFTPTSSHPLTVISNPNPIPSSAPYFPVFAHASPTSSSLQTSAIRRLPSYSSSTSASGYFQPSSAPSFSVSSGDNPMTLSSIQISSYSTADSDNLPLSSATNPVSSSTTSRRYPPTYSFVSSQPSNVSANTDSFPPVSGYNPQYSSSSVSFLKHLPTSTSFSKPSCHLSQSATSHLSASGLSQASPTRPTRSFLAPPSVAPLQSSYLSASSFSDAFQSLITSPTPLPPSGNSPSSSTPYASSSESYQPPSYPYATSFVDTSSPQPQTCQPRKTFSTLVSPSGCLPTSTSYTSSNVYPPSYHLASSFSDSSSLQYLSHQPPKTSASFLGPSCNVPKPTNAYTASKSYQSPYPFASSFQDASLQPHSRPGSENSTSLHAPGSLTPSPNTYVFSSKRCQPPSYPSGISGLPTTVVSSPLKPESRRRKFNHIPSSSISSTSTSNACSYFPSQPERLNPHSTWKEHSHRLKRRSSNSSRSSSCFVPPSSIVRSFPSVPSSYSPNRTNFVSRLSSSVSHPSAHLSFSGNLQALPPPLYSAQHPSQLVSSFPSSNSHFLQSTPKAPSFAQISVTSSQIYPSFSSESPSATSFHSPVSTNASSGSANVSSAPILLPSSPEFLRPSSESPVTLDLDQFQL